MNDVVFEGLKTIFNSINLSTGFVHPNDKGRTIEMLRKLNKSGYSLDPIQIGEWASQNGLDPEYVEDLKDYVIGVNSDKKYQIGKEPYWKENIVEILEKKTE